MFDLHPLTPSIGAEIRGVDLSFVGPNEAARLKDALARHQVLFFRDQTLGLDAQKALTALMGPVQRLPYVEPMAGEPEVIRVLKEADEGGGVFGGTAADDGFEGVNGQAGVFGVDFVFGDRAVVEPGGPADASDGQLVRAVAAVDQPGALGP